MNKILEGLKDAVEHAKGVTELNVLRFHITEAAVDRFETDRVIFDRKEGKEVRRYDLGDPANYASSHGGMSDAEWFEHKGLDSLERIPASSAAPVPSYPTPSDHFHFDYTDYDGPLSDDE